MPAKPSAETLEIHTFLDSVWDIEDRKRYWKNAGPGERRCRGKGLAEKEPEDIAVILPSSKRHLIAIKTRV